MISNSPKFYTNPSRNLHEQFALCKSIPDKRPIIGMTYPRTRSIFHHLSVDSLLICFLKKSIKKKKNSGKFVFQSENTPETIVTRFHTSSWISCHLLVFVLSFDWFTRLPASSVFVRVSFRSLQLRLHQNIGKDANISHYL